MSLGYTLLDKQMDLTEWHSCGVECETDLLKNKQLEFHECILSIVVTDTDALVLKYQTICIHNDE